MKVVVYFYIEPLLTTYSELLEFYISSDRLNSYLLKEDIKNKLEEKYNLSLQKIDRVYYDLGEYHNLERLIIDWQKETPQYLLTPSINNLGNNIVEIFDRLNKLESLGIDIISLALDYYSQDFKQGELTDIKINLAELNKKIDRDKQREKLQKGHAYNRLKNLPPPGKAPYGYRRGKDRYIINKSTAVVVKDFFERFLLFGSIRGAVKFLERRYGKKIAPSTGSKWLTNPVYRGDLQYKNKEIISNTHSAIISREEAAQVDRLLRTNSYFPSRSASANRSLAGLVFCKRCNFNLTISRVTKKRKKQEYIYLRCLHCPNNPKCKAINYQKFLERVINQICQELPIAVAKFNQPNLEEIKQKIEQQIIDKEKILETLEGLVERDILDIETANLRRYKLQQEIAELKNKIDRLPPGSLKAIVNNVTLPQFWLDLSEAERRFYFREFLKKINMIPLEDGDWELELNFIF